jgi:hypothetical protein
VLPNNIKKNTWCVGTSSSLAYLQLGLNNNNKITVILESGKKNKKSLIIV